MTIVVVKAELPVTVAGAEDVLVKGAESMEIFSEAISIVNLEGF